MPSHIHGSYDGASSKNRSLRHSKAEQPKLFRHNTLSFTTFIGHVVAEENIISLVKLFKTSG